MKPYTGRALESSYVLGCKARAVIFELLPFMTVYRVGFRRVAFLPILQVSMSRNRVLASFLAIVLTAPVGAQQPAPPPAAAVSATSILPTDPKVRIGTLPNGIRYYIRQNSRPEKRAELRLVVNAGSIQETENERGFAHVLEHTAFNGTTHFAKNDLIKYLE